MGRKSVRDVVSWRLRRSGNVQVSKDILVELVLVDHFVFIHSEYLEVRKWIKLPLKLSASQSDAAQLHGAMARQDVVSFSNANASGYK